MECLTIGADDLTFIKENIVNNLSANTVRGISFVSHLSESNKTQYLDICFTPNTNEEKGKKFPDGLDILMAQWIRQKYESRILRQIIMSNYGYFSKQEQAKIFRTVLDNRKKEKNNLSEIKMIQERVSEYLQTSNKIYLDGFVRFRLREYWSELENEVEEVVDEFLLQREYNEFIDLLKFFVEIQTPRVEFLHVFSKEDGQYRFLDQDKKNITQECLSEFIADLHSEEITYGDMLISVLIMLAPQKIYWHNSEIETNKELLQTAQMIFGNNLIICTGCDLCQK